MQNQDGAVSVSMAFFKKTIFNHLMVYSNNGLFRKGYVHLMVLKRPKIPGGMNRYSFKYIEVKEMANN